MNQQVTQWIAPALVVLALIAFVLYQRSGLLDPAEARKLVGEGATLVDVRSAGEFGSGHIEGAVNIPVDAIGRRASEIPRDRAAVLYCASGMRSAMAARQLKALGYERVYNLGSMSRW